VKIPCIVVHCGRDAQANGADEEALCPWHWRRSDGPLRRRYEAAWAEANKADQLGEVDLDAFKRVSDAWKQLVDHATGLGR
jgi:hypothetical protein